MQRILKENISTIVILGLRCWPTHSPFGLLHIDSLECHWCRDTWYKEIVIYALGIIGRLDACVSDLTCLISLGAALLNSMPNMISARGELIAPVIAQIWPISCKLQKIG